MAGPDYEKMTPAELITIIENQKKDTRSLQAKVQELELDKEAMVDNF